MAYFHQRPGGRIEIREAVHTERGPRSRTLASFRPPLSREDLDAAEAKAERPFDRAALLRKAAERDIEVAEESANAPARELLAALRRGAPLDPRLAEQLRERLLPAPAEPTADGIAEAAEWLGAGPVERGRGLRDVLRLYDAIAQSRDAVRERPPARLPRFSSRAPKAS